MQDFKEYIASQLVGQTLRFKCDCLMKMDFYGTIQGYVMNDNEILYDVLNEDTGKVITVGSNHPNLKVSLKSSI